MTITNLTMVLSLAALLLWLGGCTTTLEVDPDDLTRLTVIDPVPYLGKKPVGVKNFEGDLETVHYRKFITKSLAYDYNVELLRGDALKIDQNANACDYLLEISVHPEFEGSWVNALLTFPGFLVFAPSWNGFYYDAILNTEVEISSISGEVLSTLVEKPRLGINHMDFGRSFWAYSGWWMPGLGATSLLSAPFMASADDDICSPFLQTVGDTYGEYIADKIVDAINHLDTGKPLASAPSKIAREG
jgi:hypothetical protein